MIDSVAPYLTVVFVLTTLLTIGLFVRSFRSVRPPGLASKLITFLVPFWLIVTGFLAIDGFYGQFEAFPPRVVSFAVLPAVLLVAVYFAFFRADFVERLSLKTLTLLHVIRIPVEVVLLWLFQAGLVPQVMTFEGRNLDILSGLTAPLIYWLAFRGERPNRGLLIGWNLAALVLLFNIVITAVLSFPSPMQRFGFDQPNIGVTYFPFIWLPAIIVPIVFFAHLAALWKLFAGRNS
jgi:hypothetical protein